jgi:hypothetical protein
MFIAMPPFMPLITISPTSPPPREYSRRANDFIERISWTKKITSCPRIVLNLPNLNLLHVGGQIQCALSPSRHCLPKQPATTLIPETSHTRPHKSGHGHSNESSYKLLSATAVCCQFSQPIIQKKAILISIFHIRSKPATAQCG